MAEGRADEGVEILHRSLLRPAAQPPLTGVEALAGHPGCKGPRRVHPLDQISVIALGLAGQAAEGGKNHGAGEGFAVVGEVAAREAQRYPPAKAAQQVLEVLELLGEPIRRRGYGAAEAAALRVEHQRVRKARRREPAVVEAEDDRLRAAAVTAGPDRGHVNAAGPGAAAADPQPIGKLGQPLPRAEPRGGGGALGRRQGPAHRVDFVEQLLAGETVERISDSGVGAQQGRGRRDGAGGAHVGGRARLDQGFHDPGEGAGALPSPHASRVGLIVLPLVPGGPGVPGVPGAAVKLPGQALDLFVETADVAVAAEADSHAAQSSCEPGRADRVTLVIHPETQQPRLEHAQEGGLPEALADPAQPGGQQAPRPREASGHAVGEGHGDAQVEGLVEAEDRQGGVVDERDVRLGGRVEHLDAVEGDPAGQAPAKGLAHLVDLTHRVDDAGRAAGQGRGGGGQFRGREEGQVGVTTGVLADDRPIDRKLHAAPLGKGIEEIPLEGGQSQVLGNEQEDRTRAWVGFLAYLLGRQPHGVGVVDELAVDEPGLVGLEQSLKLPPLLGILEVRRVQRPRGDPRHAQVEQGLLGEGQQPRGDFGGAEVATVVHGPVPRRGDDDPSFGRCRNRVPAGGELLGEKPDRQAAGGLDAHVDHRRAGTGDPLEPLVGNAPRGRDEPLLIEDVLAANAGEGVDEGVRGGGNHQRSAISDQREQKNGLPYRLRLTRRRPRTAGVRDRIHDRSPPTCPPSPSTARSASSSRGS